MPWRTASPLRGQTRPTWPGGISRDKPVGTAARPPGGSVTASAARRSAPAAPSVAYSGSAPSPSMRISRGMGRDYSQARIAPDEHEHDHGRAHEQEHESGHGRRAR